MSETGKIFGKADMTIRKSNGKEITLVGFDEDNELEIEIMGESIWLNLHESNQIKNFLTREIEKRLEILK